MTTPTYITDILSPVFSETETVGDSVRIHTHCLYPDGTGVAVSVKRAGEDAWIIDDEGGAWSVLREHFFEPSPRSAKKRSEKISADSGVHFDGVRWALSHLSHGQLVGGILSVANASQSWAIRMMGETTTRHADHIEKDLLKRLTETFGGDKIVVDPSIRGLNKTHELSASVALSNNRIAVFEVVTPYPASFYPAYTKFSDIRSAKKHPDYLEIVIDDSPMWKAEDISLLRSVSNSVIDIRNGLPAFLSNLRA